EPEPDAGRPSPLAGARARRRSPSPTAAAAEQAGGRNGRFARESTDDSSANRPGHVEELAADVARRVRLALSGLRASRARSSSFTGSSSSRSPASPASSAPPPARRSTPAAGDRKKRSGPTSYNKRRGKWKRPTARPPLRRTTLAPRTSSSAAL